MKRIKTLAFGLVLALAGVVYAAGTGAQQPAPHACDKDKAGCCAQGANASCAGGGSCCKTAKSGHKHDAAQASERSADGECCCQEGASCCKAGASCCAARKHVGDEQQKVTDATVTQEDGESCCADGASCCTGGSCCKAKVAQS